MRRFSCVLSDTDLPELLVALGPLLARMEHLSVDMIEGRVEPPLRLEAPPPKKLKQFRASRKRVDKLPKEITAYAATVEAFRIADLRGRYADLSEAVLRRVVDNLRKSRVLKIAGGNPRQGGYVFALEEPAG